MSAEKVIARVGITKVTFYRHFPTKDDRIVAHLDRRATWEPDAAMPPPNTPTPTTRH